MIVAGLEGDYLSYYLLYFGFRDACSLLNFLYIPTPLPPPLWFNSILVDRRSFGSVLDIIPLADSVTKFNYWETCFLYLKEDRWDKQNWLAELMSICLYIGRALCQRASSERSCKECRGIPEAPMWHLHTVHIILFIGTIGLPEFSAFRGAWLVTILYLYYGCKWNGINRKNVHSYLNTLMQLGDIFISL